ncbi:RSP14 protein, partial [Nothoprocta ornata]|nr:RSP14 protein [Nothoprocta pentlandii]NWX97214.1 RSP14 protein [Nothoprocta ornata]
MAHARISAELPPDIDPTKAPLAFGERALPKLNEELRAPELLTRQRALMALCDLLHDPENVYQATQLGFLDNLKILLLDSDSTVRQKSTEALYIMATHNVGRHGFIQNRVIPALAQLLDDPVDICRKNVHQSFEMMARLPEGALDMLQADLIPSLVSKLKTELDEIQELILDTLANCLCLEASDALASGAVTILKDKLAHPSAAIRSKAAWVLLGIGIHPEGKTTALEEDIIPVLVSLLEDPEPEVQAKAAGALMFATVTPQGRYSALGAEAIPPLLKLLAAEASEARLSATKALTMLAELPEGRQILLGHLAAFERRLSDPAEAVRRAAEIAIRVIKWTP